MTAARRAAPAAGLAASAAGPAARAPRRRVARAGPLGAAGLAIALWSLNATAGAAALERLSVWRVLFAEFAAALIVVIVHRLVTRGGRPDRRAAGLGAVGLGGTTVLQYVAFATAPIVAANAVAYAWPLLAALHTRRAGILALAAVGFGGVVLLLAGSGGSDTGSAPVLGFAAAGASALAMTAYTVGAGRIGGRVADALLAGTLAGAVATAGPALLDPAPWGPVWAVALSAGIGVGMLAAGYGLWSVAMAGPSGPRLAPLAYATPLLSTLLLLATGRRLGPAGLAGCGLIVACTAGVALATRERQATRTGVPTSRRL